MQASNSSRTGPPRFRHVAVVSLSRERPVKWQESLDTFLCTTFRHIHTVAVSDHHRDPGDRVWRLSSNGQSGLTVFVDFAVPDEDDQAKDPTPIVISLVDKYKREFSENDAQVLVAERNIRFNPETRFSGMTVFTVTDEQATEMVTNLIKTHSQSSDAPRGRCTDPSRVNIPHMLIDVLSTHDNEPREGYTVNCGRGAIYVWPGSYEDKIEQFKRECETVSDEDWRKFTFGKKSQTDMLWHLREYQMKLNKSRRKGGKDETDHHGELATIEMHIALREAAALPACQTESTDHAMDSGTATTI